MSQSDICYTSFCSDRWHRCPQDFIIDIIMMISKRISTESLKGKVAQGKELQFLWIVNWRNEKLSNIENQWFQYEAMEAEDQNGKSLKNLEYFNQNINIICLK